MYFIYLSNGYKKWKKYFSKLLEISEKLPDRFQRWYGDQYSLMKFVKQNKALINYLPSDLYLKL